MNTSRPTTSASETADAARKRPREPDTARVEQRHGQNGMPIKSAAAQPILGEERVDGTWRIGGTGPDEGKPAWFGPQSSVYQSSDVLRLAAGFAQGTQFRPVAPDGLLPNDARASDKPSPENRQAAIAAAEQAAEWMRSKAVQVDRRGVISSGTRRTPASSVRAPGNP